MKQILMAGLIVAGTIMLFNAVNSMAGDPLARLSAAA